MIHILKPVNCSLSQTMSSLFVLCIIYVCDEEPVEHLEVSWKGYSRNKLPIP